MAIDPALYETQLKQFLQIREDHCTESRLNLFERNNIIASLKDSEGNPVRNFNKAHFIGAGGVASWFIPQFIKSMYNFRIANGIPDTNIFTVHIYDHDVVENKNILRQNFIIEDIGINKAKVLSERYNELYPGVKVVYTPKYLYCSGFLSNLISNRSLESEEYGDTNIYAPMEFDFRESFVFNFVDNETTKHQLDYYLHRNSYSMYEYPYIDHLYFTTGCDVSNGQVFCRKFRYSPFYTQYYSDVTFTKGVEIIDEPVSCAELAETSALEQTFDSNTMAANLLNILVNNILSNFWSTHAKEIKFISGANPSVETITTMENHNFLGYLTACRSTRRR